MLKKYFIVSFYAAFIILGALSLVYIPIARTYNLGAEFAIICIYLPLAYVLWKRYGLLFSIALTLGLSLVALLIEYIGLTTGWPYGVFSYQGALGYRIADILPWTVGFSWTPLLVGSIALVYTYTQKTIIRILGPVILLVVFDLLLDPAAVALGFWEYKDIGVYYGVPFQNFIGWGVSGLIGSLICFFVFKKYPNVSMIELSYSFFLSIIFWTIVALCLGLGIPSVIGVSLILCYLVVQYVNTKKNSFN